jgi:flavodoxin
MVLLDPPLDQFNSVTSIFTEEVFMNARIFYFSQTGNTKKVAEAMAGAIGLRAEKIGGGENGIKADLLFLGAAVYATHDHGPNPAVLDFIAKLDPSMVKEASVFSTGFREGDACGKLRGLLERRGIKVRKESFFCPGRFFLFFSHGHPNADDLKRAGEFARQALSAS